MAISSPTSPGDSSMATPIAGAISQIAQGAQSIARWPRENQTRSLLLRRPLLMARAVRTEMNSPSPSIAGPC